MEANELEDVVRKNKYILELAEYVWAMKVLGWVPWRSEVVRVDGSFERKLPLWTKVYCILALVLPAICNFIFTAAALKVRLLLH